MDPARLSQALSQTTIMDESDEDSEFEDFETHRTGPLSVLDYSSKPKWDRLWFVCRADCLYWYTNSKEDKNVGLMPLKGVKILDWGMYKLSNPPKWRLNKQCTACQQEFNMFRRQHHCRNCGFAFCDKHSAQNIEIPLMGFDDPVRVCDSCFKRVQVELRNKRIIARHMMQGSLNAAAGRRVQRRFMLPDKASKRKHLFALKTRDKEIWLQAKGQQDREEWVACIRRCQAKHSPDSAPEIGDESQVSTMLLEDKDTDNEADEEDTAPTLKLPPKTLPMRMWKTEHVCNWVVSIGFRKYAQLFEQQSVDGRVLERATEKVLRDKVGITNPDDVHGLLSKVSSFLMFGNPRSPPRQSSSLDAADPLAAEQAVSRDRANAKHGTVGPALLSTIPSDGDMSITSETTTDDCDTGELTPRRAQPTQMEQKLVEKAKKKKKRHPRRVESQPPLLSDRFGPPSHNNWRSMGTGTWRKFDRNLTLIGNSITEEEQKKWKTPKGELAGLAFRPGEAVAYWDEGKQARVMGMIKRRLDEVDPEGHDSFFEVEIGADGTTGVFKASELLKFTKYEVEWQKGKLIGKGAYGKVWNGLNKKDGRLIAIKEMKLDGTASIIDDNNKRRGRGASKVSSPTKITHQSIGAVTPEINLMQMLEHPNIVKFLSAEVDIRSSKLYIFMEKVSGGSLKTIIDSYGPLTESVMVHYTRQILHGLCYLHENGVVHRDLKCSNVLLTTDGVIKLADFGVAKKVNSEDLKELSNISVKLKHDKIKIKQKLQGTNLQTMIGSPYWMAPEVVTQAGYGRKADIWSLGCTVIEMASADTPWKGYNQIAACFVIGESDKLPDIPEGLSKHCNDFILCCLQRDKEKRWTAEELLAHPWLAEEH